MQYLTRRYLLGSIPIIMVFFYLEKKATALSVIAPENILRMVVQAIENGKKKVERANFFGIIRIYDYFTMKGNHYDNVTN